MSFDGFFLDFHQFILKRETTTINNAINHQTGQVIITIKDKTASLSLMKISGKLTTKTAKPIVQTMIPMRYRYKIAVQMVIVKYYPFLVNVFSRFNTPIVYHIRVFMSIHQVLNYFIEFR